MVTPSPSESQLKDALKAALLEMLEERPDMLRDVLSEVMEDIALARAIQEVEASEPVSRAEVFGVVDS